jgi:hypothetical protein
MQTSTNRRRGWGHFKPSPRGHCEPSFRTELHLRAYLGKPPPELLEADLERIPSKLRGHMRGRGGLVEGLPELWFAPNDLRDPWRTSPEIEPRAVVLPSPPAAAGPVGTDYEPANETATSTGSAPFEIDPDERDRSTRAHAVTQNALAQAVRERGAIPRSPAGDEPSYDLAWEEADGSLIVAEVKSVKPQNVERQLRLALGQVLRYRSVLGESGRSVRALLVLSEEPHDTRWVSLCAELGVGLVWLPDMQTGMAAWLD